MAVSATRFASYVPMEKLASFAAGTLLGLTAIYIWDRKLKEYFDIPLKPSPTSTPEEKQQLEYLINRILSCEAIKKLCMKIYKTATYNHPKPGSWTIKFEKTPFGAHCDCVNREIVLSPSKLDDFLMSYLLFEMLNASQTPRFMDVDKKARELGMEEFVKKNEEIEFDNTKTYQPLYLQARKEGIRLINPWASLPDNFEEEWLSQKDTPHAENYRTLWKNHYGIPDVK